MSDEAPRLCLCGRVLSEPERINRTSAGSEYKCVECGQVSYFATLSPSTAVTLEDEFVTFTVHGVRHLPQGSVITVSVVVGPDGPIVAPPAAVPTEAPKPRRYMNEGR